MTKFVIWVLLLILSISGVIVLGIAIATSQGENQSLFILGSVICLGASLFFGKQAMKSHDGWQEKTIRTILGGSATLVHWQYDRKTWIDFAKQYSVEKRSESRSMFIMVASILLLIGIVALFASEKLDIVAFEIAAVLVILSLATSWYFIREHYKKFDDAYLNVTKPEVHVDELGMVINRKFLIAFRSVGTSLTEIKETEKYGLKGVSFFVRTSNGETDTTHEHFLPFPKDEKYKNDYSKMKELK